MSIVVKNTTSIAVEEESTEGTYVTPSGATKFVQVLESGLEMKPSKELLERNVFSGTIGKVTPRTGTRSVNGSIPTECRAHSVAGSAPEFHSLMRSAFGSSRQSSSVITTKVGNTSSVLQIEDADIASLKIGDTIMIKKAGAYHVSPIISRTTGTGTATVTLLVAHPSGSLPDGVTIEKFTTYAPAESGHPTLSITKYMDSAVREYGVGCRVNKLSLANFATGKIPTLNFGFDGLNYDRSLTAPSYSPSYDSALPPIILDAKAYMDGSEITINELSVNMENGVGFSTSIAAANGKVSSRVTSRKITGTINPYMLTDSVANYTKFINNTEFSLFAYAKNDTGTPGEFKNVVAIYLPKCLITEMSEPDSDGLVQEQLTFQATRGSTGTTDDIFMSFI